MRGIRATALILAAACTLGSQVSAQYFSYGKNKVQYNAQDWHFVQSKHFDVYYDKEGGNYLADFTARAAEEAYDIIKKDFQHEISDRISILVFESHNEFAVTNAVNLPTYAEGIGGVTELYKNRIAIPFTGDYRDYRRVVHHELVHAVINDMFYGGSIQSVIQNNIQLNIPLWFNEGISEYSAQGWDTESDMYVRDAIVNNYLAPIKYLNGYFAYRGGQGVWDYISEQYGREKIGEIFQRLRLTRSVEGSFKRAIGLDLDELSERWHKALKKVHWPELAAREDIDEVAKAIITREKGGLFNTSPAISPQGDRVAYISTRDGFFDVYVANANDGRRRKKLIDGQDNTNFESLKILTPGITWSPDGENIAIAVKSGKSDAIAVVNVKSKKTTHYRVPGLDAIISVAWSPTEPKIAFSASKDAQSDIYMLNMETRETTNLTGDIFSDHEPAWSPDGKHIVFHSDRGAYTDLFRYTTSNTDMLSQDYTQYDVYRLETGTASLQRLTFDEQWDDRTARFGADPDKFIFISDRNGINNLYEKNIATGTEKPLTDLVIGVTQLSVSADGNKAALLGLRKGTQSIYMMKTPFRNDVGQEHLIANVWAKRVMQDEVSDAPSLQLATKANRQKNPFFRDASDGSGFNRKIGGTSEVLASRTGGIDPPTSESGTAEASEMESVPGVPSVPGGSPRPDGVADEKDQEERVDFRSFVFGKEFEEVNKDEPEELVNVFNPVDNENEDGTLKQKKYKLKFSPDLIYGAAGFSTLYGVEGVTQMLFSDVMGNHQIFAATNLLIDLRNSSYLLAYSYLPNKIDWTVSGFHQARYLPDYTQGFYYRYRNYGGGITATYPLDKFRRIDLGLSMLAVSRTNVTNIQSQTSSKAFLFPSLTYTRDVTIPGFVSPASGSRYAVSITGAPGGFSEESVQFATVLADYRKYWSIGPGYTFALRGSGAASVGRTSQLFYTAGVENWVNRDFFQNQYPIEDVTDFIFATPVIPLRGTDINSMNGSYFGVVNAEFRFPLVAALLPGPIPIFALYNLQGVAFMDAGSVWGGRSDNKSFNLFQTNADGKKEFDDLIVSAGVGMRTILLGYPVRLDWAWPHDGQSFQPRKFYFSIGFDF